MDEKQDQNRTRNYNGSYLTREWKSQGMRPWKFWGRRTFSLNTQTKNKQIIIKSERWIQLFFRQVSSPKVDLPFNFSQEATRVCTSAEQGSKPKKKSSRIRKRRIQLRGEAQGILRSEVGDWASKAALCATVPKSCPGHSQSTTPFRKSVSKVVMITSVCSDTLRGDLSFCRIV